MKPTFCMRSATAAAGLLAMIASVDGQGQAAPGCKAVQGTMVEARATAGCRDGRPSCFLGTVDGDHGLNGTTYFHGDSSGTPSPASPTFAPYAGRFEYATTRGTISTRETGIVSGEEGVVTAFQKITSGTGDYAGVSGHFYVFGTTSGSSVTTTLSGRICQP